MWKFRFERNSFERHKGTDPRRWPTEEEAAEAAFKWQDAHVDYMVYIEEDSNP